MALAGLVQAMLPMAFSSFSTEQKVIMSRLFQAAQ
jgi:hypothetical protein